MPEQVNCYGQWLCAMGQQLILYFFQVKSLPSVENLKSTSTACWNKSVYNAGEFVIDVPNKCVCAANKAYELVEIQLNKPQGN